MRRRVLLSGVLALAACSESGPDQVEALAEITKSIRSQYPMNEKRLQGLLFQESNDLADGRFEVFVQYDLVANMPDYGLFGTQFAAGYKTHIEKERYVFKRGPRGWVLE